MEINEELIKPITETAYLTKENTKRYRPILRFFYEQYEKYNYMLYKEEVFQIFYGKKNFEQYTIEQCESDLTALVEWKNLIALQDTTTAYTLEEFKHKKYRYQMSEYAVQIERLVLKLESLHIEGSSLEPSLIERIRTEIEKIEAISNKNETEVNGWWENLNSDFKRLNQSYQDYIKTFYSVKMEDIAKSNQFILYKSDLIKYLRQFIQSLQNNSYIIESVLSVLKPEVEQEILKKILNHQKNIVRIDRLEEEFPEEEIKNRNKEKWNNLKIWFIGTEKRISEVVNVNEKTSEIIRKITRIANQIAESKGNVNSRKAEYKKICEMFCKTSSIEEAHKLSSMVFGIVNTRHIKGDFARETDSINSGIIEEKNIEIEVKPRVREFKQKLQRTIIEDKSKEKQEQKQKYLKQKEKERKILEKYIINGKITIEELPIIEPAIRKILLNWISRANLSTSKETKTEDGRKVILHFPEQNKICKLRCTDGTLTMPAFVLEIS